MANFDQLEKKICLQKLINMLKSRSEREKNCLLDHNLSTEKQFTAFQKNTSLLNEKQKYLLKCLLVTQNHNILADAIKSNNLDKLLNHLSQIDSFFSDIGGIIGYQNQVFKVLKKTVTTKKNSSIKAPFFIDITEENNHVKDYIKEGILSLDRMAEIYVVGGAADRLHLFDEKCFKRLPAANMKLFSKELLVRLIEDLQAKEYLYEKITNKKIITPIALMCSEENNNFKHIKNLIEENNYFNRKKENFFFLVQPSVPVIRKDGSWVSSKGNLLLKPSGHGALWKLALENKLFEWFFAKKREKALVRQINNPIAGVDYGLLAFIGYGLKHSSDFGFASCQRQVHSAEGINVLIEKKLANSYEYCITNIEYCEFEKFQIEDKSSNLFSKYPSNTNLLFVDLKKIKTKIKKKPYPGILINFKPMKSKFSKKPLIAGRLETTMQNIADAFTEKYQKPLKEPYKLLNTYVTYNFRHKTISTAKRVYKSNQEYLETPEKCFYDFIYNAHDLLKNYCAFKVPKVESFFNFNSKWPPFLFSYHPALGPIYRLIGEKLQQGSLSTHSELMLNIAEIYCRKLDLKGSLRIFAKDLSSKCCLQNVKVKNNGIDFSGVENFWKGSFSHFQKCDIYLGKNATLIADNVTILNEQTFVVPDNETVEIIEKSGKPFLRKSAKKFQINYYFTKSDEIIAEKQISPAIINR